MYLMNWKFKWIGDLYVDVYKSIQYHLFTHANCKYFWRKQREGFYTRMQYYKLDSCYFRIPTLNKNFSIHLLIVDDGKLTPNHIYSSSWHLYFCLVPLASIIWGKSLIQGQLKPRLRTYQKIIMYYLYIHMLNGAHCVCVLLCDC